MRSLKESEDYKILQKAGCSIKSGRERLLGPVHGSVMAASLRTERTKNASPRRALDDGEAGEVAAAQGALLKS